MFLNLTYKMGLKLSGQSDHEVIHSRPRWMSDARPTVIRRSRIRSPPVRQHSVMEIDHKIFFTVIFSLPLIHERKLSGFGERMYTNTGQLLR